MSYELVHATVRLANSAVGSIGKGGFGYDTTSPTGRQIVVVALLLMPASAFSQSSTTGAASAPPPAKSTVKADMVPSLIVMNARSASLQGQTLTLTGTSANSIVFADRPVRAAGHLLTAHLLEEWSDGSFAKDPPNATVSVLSKDGASVHDAVVELRDPHLDGDRLTFDVRLLEGDLAGADGRPRCLSTS